MGTFITLIDFTDQGARTMKDSPSRAEAFEDAARTAGVTIKQIYWTMGAYDGVLILDAPDKESAASLLFSLAQAGNVRTKTLLAFEQNEMLRILGGR